jgi:putative hemolysin
MTHFTRAYAALIAASLVAACTSANNGTQQQSASATASPIPAPSMPPHASMTAAPQRNCGQPGGTVDYVDAHTGLPIVISPNERISAWSPPWFGVGSAFSWTIQNVNTQATRVVYPMVPIIVGEVSQHLHDVSTVEVLPIGSSANQTLVNDYLWHLQYTAYVAQQARKDSLSGQPLPTPNPQESAREAKFDTSVPPAQSEQQMLAQIVEGSPPDDTDFENAAGDPNAQDPHEYDFACKFLDSEPYTLVWRIETRHQVLNSSYSNVQATLAANSAPPEIMGTGGSVGWAAWQYLTYVATPITPTLAQMTVIASPSPGADVPLIKQYTWQVLACQDLTTAPTAAPSGAPAPMDTGTCAPTIPSH